MELLVFLGFLCVPFPRKFMGLWVCWRMAWILCLWVYLWFGLVLGFISSFPGFYGDWIWLLGLDLGFARD